MLTGSKLGAARKCGTLREAKGDAMRSASVGERAILDRPFRALQFRRRNNPALPWAGIGAALLGPGHGVGNGPGMGELEMGLGMAPEMSQ